ncbi:hypothetical protein ACQKCU_02830 [Heyndrickxia sporothermodurans]
MNTKLIIVEGLPGFGKSTTANIIYDILKGNNINAELFLEGNLDHPADYDGVSCFNKNEFECLLSNSGEFKEILINRVIKKGNHYLVPYQKIKIEYGEKFSEQLLITIFKNDIYELPLVQNIELITDKWTDFAEEALKNNKTYIFECCFIQNPLTIGMIKYGEQKEKVINYVSTLSKIIEKLNPVLFYVEQDDLEFSFKKAFNERTKEWSTGFIEYYTNQGYGKAHGYKGLEGTLKVLEARRALEREIFDRLKLKKEIINNSKYEAEKYKSMIIEKLSLLEVL